MPTPPTAVRHLPTAADQPVLLYDGYCGLCNRAVQWVVAHDRSALFRFAALDSRFADQVRSRHPELVGVDSLVLVEAIDDVERVLVRSDAVLGVLERIPRWRTLAPVVRVIPRQIRDAVYAYVARHRLWWFGRSTACPLPTPADRSRFLLDR